MILCMDLKLTYYQPDLPVVIRGFGLLNRIEGERVSVFFSTRTMHRLLS